MSPTSYQAAPPRFITIADEGWEVKPRDLPSVTRVMARTEVTSSEHGAFARLRLRAEGPGDDILRGGLAAGAAGESDIRGVAADGAGDIDKPGSGEGGVGHRVRNGHGERGAVVSHVHLENIAAVQTDSATESDRRTGGRGAIGVHPGGVVAFLRILEQIEFHRDANGNSTRAARQARTVAETSAGGAECGRARVLNRERHAIRIGIDDLKREVAGEGLDVHRRGKP